MRTLSKILATTTILAPSLVFGDVQDTLHETRHPVSDVILNGNAKEGHQAKAVETLKLRIDERGCYVLAGPESKLSLSLCEDDIGARQQFTKEGTPIKTVNDGLSFAMSESPVETFSWVNGTVTNIGEVPICYVAFASRDTNLLAEALHTIPVNLPTTTVDVPPVESVDLAPGQAIDFAYLLPFDDSRDVPAFVGLANSLQACSHAVRTFVPVMSVMTKATDVGKVDDKGAGASASTTVIDKTQGKSAAAVDTIQATANNALDSTQSKLDEAINNLQNALGRSEANKTVPVATRTSVDANAASVGSISKDAAKPAADEVTKETGTDTNRDASHSATEEEGLVNTSPAGHVTTSANIFLLVLTATLSGMAVFL